MADMKLIKAFNNAMHAETGGTEPYDTTAEVVRIEGSTAWVHIPGGVDETPVQMTVNAEPGDTVQVRVGGGTAWITGNASAPPTDDKTANAAKQTATEAQEAAVEASDTATRAERNADSAIKIAGNTAQHFWFTETGSDTGAHITEVTEEEFLSDPQNGGGNLLARSNGIAIRDGMTELASFGETMQLGEEGKSHAELDYHSLELVDKDGNSYFRASDLRGTNGQVEVTEVFWGDNTQRAYRLGMPAINNGNPVPVITDEDGNDVTSTYYQTKDKNSITLTNYLPIGYTLTVTYTTASELAKAYTAGIRKANGQVGGMSFAEGYNTTASGVYSHAQGYNATAYGRVSHAEGSNTTANGWASHAEGYSTTASGYGAHAEGGDTEADGRHAHAEGYNTTASGVYSHAQNQGTIASSANQTAMGKFNEADSSGTYAAIIGNGTSDSARSNAFTVDWDGNVEAAGDITDGSGNVLANKADASVLTGIFKIVEYTHAYTNLAAGAGLYITANDFGASTPSGYRPAAVLTCNSGSAANCSVVYFNGAATGTNNMMRIVNTSTAARSYTARITILYVMSSMVAS